MGSQVTQAFLPGTFDLIGFICFSKFDLEKFGNVPPAHSVLLFAVYIGMLWMSWLRSSSRSFIQAQHFSLMNKTNKRSWGKIRRAGMLAISPNSRLGPASLKTFLIASACQVRAQVRPHVNMGCVWPQDFACILLALEAAVRPDRLKPWWRLWCSPLPHPSLTGQPRLPSHHATQFS